ncbi:uncharacterized protein [Diadema setosum]|uniref:uncharacterized protein n=1 Tax=Diadema setosum TaxID=31175 RepID=UPI003B3AFD43
MPTRVLDFVSVQVADEPGLEEKQTHRENTINPADVGYSTMGGYSTLCILLGLLILRSEGQPPEIGCCSPPMLQADQIAARCPSSAMTSECDPSGCCIFANTSSLGLTQQVEDPYACLNSTLVIERFRVCDGTPDCPRRDDELFCYPYQCAVPNFATSSGDVIALCPFNNTCYQPTASCQSNQKCPRGRESTNENNVPTAAFVTLGASIALEKTVTKIKRLHQRVTYNEFKGKCEIRRNASRAFVNGAVVIDMAIAPYLDTLILRGSSLSNITSLMLEGLSTLTYMNFNFNRIRSLAAGTFIDLINLEVLTLQSNDIGYIETGAFDGLISLRILDLGGNEISRIDPGAFYSLIRVDAIVLTEAELIELPVDIFEGLDGLRDLYVNDFRLCCRVVNLENCIDYAQTRFSTCTGGLLQYQVLSIFMWILGFSALLGNAFVLVMRLREKGGRSEKALIQAIMIMNLAAADFLTGVYMIFLASADAAYGSNYFVHAHIWRKGPLCKVVGVIAVLSSEASVLMITLISLDRLQGVVFPFSRFHLTKKSVKIFAAVIWIVSVIMSLIPPIVTHVLTDGDSFYIYSDVCLGLPLIRSTEVEFTFQNFDSTAYENNQPVVSSAAVGNYMYYSIIVFIGVNLLSFLIIMFIYVTIFVYARRSARKAQRTPERDQELRLAARMALIIGTDFCCWMPIIIMGILAQSGAFVIPTELYAWCVVFILPINSAVNPHLYTLGDLYTRRREERESRKSSSLNSGFEHFPKEKKPPQASKESTF